MKIIYTLAEGLVWGLAALIWGNIMADAYMTWSWYHS